MIETLLLKNFKCFEEQVFEFAQLTVLTGINGTGKSTVLQSLLLLHQSHQSGIPGQPLLLNGVDIQMGTGEDVLYEKAQNDIIEITCQEDGTLYRHCYQFEEGMDRLRSIQETTDASPASALCDERFCSLSAYRIEPRDLYEVRNRADIHKRRYGRSGEYALQYLSEYGGTTPLLSEAGNTKDSLQEQVVYWMSEISPGVVPLISVDDKKRIAELHYEFIEGNEKTNSYKSIHVGFGITYVLPVVVALLSAKKGDIVAIENPESHIHPRGQRKLGELMALVAAQDVQVIVETHSDHILNGIRAAVKQKMLEAQKVKLLYLYKERGSDYQHKVKNPILLESGQLTEWPEGFFDEWDNALLDLL